MTNNNPSPVEGHTPGPWIAFPDPNHPPFILIAHKTQDKIIARVTTADAPSGGSNKANALLIASAPAMLSELTTLKKEVERLKEALILLIDCCDGNYEEAVAIAKKALTPQ